MAKFVSFETLPGYTVWVNVDHIKSMTEIEGATELNMGSDERSISLKEPIQDVLAKIERA